MVPDKFVVHYTEWDMRNWPKLDVDKPSTFEPWFNRAHRWLHAGNSSVRRLLELLEREKQPLTEFREAELAREASLPMFWSVAEVSRVIGNAIVRVSAESVAALADKLGEDRGLELYRFLYARFRGVGPGLAQQALDAVTSPKRCRNTSELRHELVELSTLFRKLERYGDDYKLSPPQRVMALKRRLPADLLRDLENAMLVENDATYEIVTN